MRDSVNITYERVVAGNVDYPVVVKQTFVKSDIYCPGCGDNSNIYRLLTSYIDKSRTYVCIGCGNGCLTAYNEQAPDDVVRLIKEGLEVD
jgi:predicted RNA-binding Zn-ribbon protein involved in translation (DUF1610 family)